LIFGLRPLETLAVTFVSAWVEDGKTPEVRTVYFSFTDVSAQTAVWHTIAKDLPLERAA